MRISLILLLMLSPVVVSGQSAYRKPPETVAKILDAPPPASLSVSPSKTHALVVQSARNPSIAEVAEPMLRIAGLRINPKTNGPAGTSRITSLGIIDLAKPTDVKPIALPAGRIGSPDWSPDGQSFAVTVTTDTGIQLAIDRVEHFGGLKFPGDLIVRSLLPFPDIQLNAVLGDPVQWLNGSEKLLVRIVPPGRGAPPEAPKAPVGPTVQESDGKAAPVRTYQDLLKNAHDEALFEYYATSQLAIVDVKTGKLTLVGKPDLIASVDPSPDGSGHFLLTTIRKPFSYLYPVSSFPRRIEVYDVNKGESKIVIAEKPLEDSVPIEGVPIGPRSVRWVPNLPRTLVWVEALDGGDPKKKVPHRDQFFTMNVDDRKKLPGMKIEQRFQGISFFESGNVSLVRDFDRDRRWGRTMLAAYGQSEAANPKVLFERSTQDRYGDPGTPLTKTLPNGERVLRVISQKGILEDGKLVMSGLGASPKGERPFLDLIDLRTGERTERVWQCGEGVYESAQLLSDDCQTLLVRRESPTDPGNYFIKAGDVVTKITNNVDPAPLLRQVKKQVVTTKRPDGVTISFTLYTPPGFEAGKDKPLPTVVWAYPREFNSASDAGQISGSPYRFTTLSSYSHLAFVLLGYAVMDEVSMPIVGPVETANDNFLEQLVSNAKTAIDKGVELGAVDRGRVGVGGHSYGAFMTANLLAHSDLFRAGIARSGAYNRTLTPFGFQNERRTFWEAPQIYSTMSPFNSAHKIKEPLLLIHGEADNNPGTFPVQSERMYQAVRGNGGTVRLVLLPHESHGYSAKESTDHCLAEMIGWFDVHVKNAATKGE